MKTRRKPKRKERGHGEGGIEKVSNMASSGIATSEVELLKHGLHLISSLMPGVPESSPLLVSLHRIAGHCHISLH